MRRSLACLILMSGLFLASPPAVHGQRGERPVLKTFVLSVGGSQRLQMTTKQRIRQVFNDRPDVVRISPMENDPTTVLITGVAPGSTRITLVGEDGKVEVCRIGKPAEGTP